MPALTKNHGYATEQDFAGIIIILFFYYLCGNLNNCIIISDAPTKLGETSTDDENKIKTESSIQQLMSQKHFNNLPQMPPSTPVRHFYFLGNCSPNN